MESWHSWPKHLLYLSPSKIDALYNQLDSSRVATIAKKLTINLKVLQAELSSRPAPETVFHRLKIVLAYLEEHDYIGSISNPGGYFAARLPMRWAPYGDQPEDTGLVWFGAVEDGTALGLGGSSHNMTGEIGTSPAHSASATFAMVRILEAELSKTHHGPLDLWDPHLDRWEETALVAIELASGWMHGPLQDVEFVAKRLLWGSGRDTDHVLLGTPLYVAMAD